MADNKWTDEQLKAIEMRGRRILVSAAAGSGKTAVLVERIIRRILDKENPVDVDRILVMTFTRAAAAEMKERIRKRLEDALESTDYLSDAYHRIKKQIAIIDSASIQTIDSFCINVVRERSDDINIDPSSRIADEAELKLIQADVMDAMLEEYYEKSDDDFVAFAEAFGEKTDGHGLEEKILSVFRFANITADPKGWYEEQINGSGFEKCTSYIYGFLKEVIASYLEIYDEMLEICGRSGGPSHYEKAIKDDIAYLEKAVDAQDYEELCRSLRGHVFTKLAPKAKEGTDEYLKEKVKSMRNDAKKSINEWIASYTRESLQDALDEREMAFNYIKTLVRLAEDFDSRFTEAKRKRNVLDFNDAEHMALNVLKKSDDYKEYFEEIYVDEYQDTNALQEEIIKALDNGNVFLVGDVKQSIYKFRQARPEIFMNKLETFASSEESDEGVDTGLSLSANFRSRSQVLDSVNRLFRALMRKSVGGVDYNKAAELNFAAHFGTTEADEKKQKDGADAVMPVADVYDAGRDDGGKDAGDVYNTELLVADTQYQDTDDDGHTAEAAMIASKISEITDPDKGIKIWDNNIDSYRSLVYSDIVILLRSANTSGDTYLNTLLECGIPAHCETNKGYFDSLEVRTITAMLSAIDNPSKEIEYTAFLRSPIIGMNDDELVMLRRAPERLGVSGQYKLNRAEEMLSGYRAMSRYMSIAELITHIYDETGYYEYASALPAGNIRKANLDKLKSMASEYASTGYKGLFNFIRYIDNLKSYDTDFGEASAISENDNAVRIMSIHKSKGLEFPVCFVADCGKKVNQTDSNRSIMVDDDLGIGCAYIDTGRRTKKLTLTQAALRLKLRNDAYGEEIRVLYVAMTRAKEKLYLTASVKNPDTFLEAYNGAYDADGSPLPVVKIRSDKGYLNWILESGVKYPITVFEPDDVKVFSAAPDYADAAGKFLKAATIDTDLRDEYDRLFKAEYAYKSDVDLKNKVSISELKKRWMEDSEEVFERFVPGGTEKDSGTEISVSGAAASGSAASGSERGTLYHSVMEKLDYSNPDFAAIPPEVDPDDIRKFLDSDLGREFSEAFAAGRLKREQQFIMGVPARELKIADSDEPVLVQGIIDAYIDGSGGVTLVDYKTDRVSSGDELIKRYEGQLYYYAMALEKITGHAVKRKIIWSFTLSKAIEL